MLMPSGPPVAVRPTIQSDKVWLVCPWHINDIVSAYFTDTLSGQLILHTPQVQGPVYNRGWLSPVCVYIILFNITSRDPTSVHTRVSDYSRHHKWRLLVYPKDRQVHNVTTHNFRQTTLWAAIPSRENKYMKTLAASSISYFPCDFSSPPNIYIPFTTNLEFIPLSPTQLNFPLAPSMSF